MRPRPRSPRRVSPIQSCWRGSRPSSKWRWRSAFSPACTSARSRSSRSPTSCSWPSPSTAQIAGAPIRWSSASSSITSSSSPGCCSRRCTDPATVWLSNDPSIPGGKHDREDDHLPLVRQRRGEQSRRILCVDLPRQPRGQDQRLTCRFSGREEGRRADRRVHGAWTAVPGPERGPLFKPNEAVSFIVVTEDQKETDRYWDAIVQSGGQESACGWCKDKWGFSWQITPRRLLDLTTDASDPAKAKRAFEAMMTMRKIDIATIEAAAAGESIDA